ncbi:MAG: hypothetical protein WDO17_15665 [Alphaproteobacteria bacterium]
MSLLAQQADDMDALAGMSLANVKATEAKLGRTLEALETADSEQRTEQLKADAHALGTELETLRTTQAERFARRNAARTLFTSISGWVDKLPPNVTLASVPPPAREPGDERTRATCDRHRKEIAELQKQIDATRKAPLTHSEAKHWVLGWIDRHARLGRPHIVVDSEKADVFFQNARALVPGDRLALPASADLFVWLFRDEVTVALSREVDARTLDGAMSREERAANLVTLRAALLDVERAEEAAIVRAAEEGTIIARRADANPLAVLGVQFVGAASKAA